MLDTDEIRVGGNGAISFAPYATTVNIPMAGDDPRDSLDAAFVNAGYLTEDGAGFKAERNFDPIKSWQSLDPVRMLLTERTTTLSFTLQQAFNSENLPLVFGGGVVEDHGGGIFSYTPPAAEDGVDERVLVLDWQDGDIEYRIVVPRGIITSATEFSAKRGEEIKVPAEFSALTVAGQNPWELLTNDHSLSAGS